MNDATPRAAVIRLSLYLRYLEMLYKANVETVSSGQLGTALEISDTQVRKDLAYFGQFGCPGIGYRVADLRDAIKAVFGIDRTWRLGLIGLGNIGRALLHYQGFSSRGFQIVTLFDASPAIIGQTFSGMEVFDIQRLSEKVAELDLDLVVLAVPAHAIDDVTKIVASSGVSGILNFAPVQLKVPPEISVVTVDLGQQLEQLAFQVTCRKKSLESLPPSLTGT